jgi:MFS superfamily sulfate permease-like transporter
MAFRTIENLGKDLPAGVVVFLVALPLCLGVALASGAPLISGIIAGIVGGVVVSLLSGSQLSVSGPAAGLTAITMSGIETLGGFERFLMAVILAGFFQVVLGYLRAGSLAAYFPSAVIEGMLAAIGLILILKQFPHALGYGIDTLTDETYSPESPGSVLREISDAMRGISSGATVISMVSILIMKLWEQPLSRKFALVRALPGPLVAVMWGVGFQFFAQGSDFHISGQHLVSLPARQFIGDLTDQLIAPDFSSIFNPDVWRFALTIGVIASVESLLSLEAIDKLDPQRRVTPPDRELKAQGIGNIISGCLGGLPITSVIVRSSANVNAGGRTRLSSFTHGLLLLVSAVFLVEWINRIPLSALAAILLVTGYKLSRPKIFLMMWRRGFAQFAPFIATIIAVLVSDLLKGIAIGLLIGLIFVIHANFRAAISLTMNGNQAFIKLRKDVTFLNKPLLRKILAGLPENVEVIIDGSHAEFIDLDILGCILDFSLNARTKGNWVHLRSVQGVSGENPVDALRGMLGQVSGGQQ